MLSRKIKKNTLQKRRGGRRLDRRADAARRMGCCESSNRRKIDETLNPIMGTVRIAVAACAMQAVASTSDRFRRLQAAQDQLTPLMSEAAFKGDVATMDRLVVSQSAVRGLVLCHRNVRITSTHTTPSASHPFPTLTHHTGMPHSLPHFRSRERAQSGRTSVRFQHVIVTWTLPRLRALP